MRFIHFQKVQKRLMNNLLLHLEMVQESVGRHIMVQQESYKILTGVIKHLSLIYR